MKEFTIVTAVTPDYEDKLRLCLPTWKYKPQFKNQKMIIFAHGFKNSSKRFKDLWEDLEVIDWDMLNYDSQRELMLSAFILGAAKHVKTDYWVKIDGDTHFTSPEDVFASEDFQYDISANRWGYSFSTDINLLKEWGAANEFTGTCPLQNIEVNPNSKTFGHKRFISYICLHNSEFVREVADIVGDRLPCPSHDTTLWYFAERLPHRKFRRSLLKRKGVCQRKHYKSIVSEVDKANFLFHPKKGYLFEALQIELTTDCNLKCYNCDRACGLAPSKEFVSLQKIKYLLEQCSHPTWNLKRIDLIGGEPTLYPHLEALWDLIYKYKKKYSCKVRFSTNGCGEEVNRILESVPSWVRIRNSSKSSKENKFFNFNNAPIDHGIEEAPYCNIPWRCGLGYNNGGIFPCGAGAAIDRVFGLGVGVDTIKEASVEKIREQLKVLCKYCGHSPTKFRHRTHEVEISDSWADAIRKYNV